MKQVTSDKVKKTFRQIQKSAQAAVILKALRELDETCSDSTEQRIAIREFSNFLCSLEDVDPTEFAFIDLGCEK